MIKVLFFLNVLGSGGAEMHTVRLAEPLLQHGIEPIYATCRGGGSYERMLPAGTTHRVLGTGASGSTVVQLVRSVRPLARLIDELQPDIVCPVLSLTTLPAFAAVSMARHKPKIVPLIQNALSGQFLNSPRPLARLQRWWTARQWPRADAVIALSEGVGREITEFIPALKGRVQVIYNVGKPLEKQIAEARNATVAPPEGRALIVACGRLIEQKDYPTMLAAFARLQTRPRPELRILGTGPDADALRKLAGELGIGDEVKFLGFRDDALAYMARADLFVLSSRWEGFGNVVVEAMAMGTAVVATDCPHGPGEIIADGENGLLVPVGDADRLAAAIDLLLSDAEQRERIAASGRDRAEDFTASRIGTAYASALSQVATDRPTGCPS